MMMMEATNLVKGEELDEDADHLSPEIMWETLLCRLRVTLPPAAWRL